jgi:hypothetical protein
MSGGGGGGVSPLLGTVNWTKAQFERFRQKYGINVTQASGWAAVAIMREDWETMSRHFGQDVLNQITDGRKAVFFVAWADYPGMAQGEPLLFNGQRWVINQQKEWVVGNGANTTQVCYVMLGIQGGRT